MSERKERIVELYHLTNSFKFGSFLLSAHRDNPTLPPSPYYLHYPTKGQPGSEQLPELFELVGAEFDEMAQQLPQPQQKRKIAAVPRGAWPIGEATARRDARHYPSNLLIFDKIEEEDGTTRFVGPKGEYEIGDELLAVEDHTSGGRNKKIMKVAAEISGLVIPTMFTVVDRMQGGVANMAAVGVELRSIFTVYDFLDLSQTAGFINETQVDTVKAYILDNQL